MITERWAEPIRPIDVEDAGKSFIYKGIHYNVPTYILAHDDVERIRLGYVCIICLEPHEHPHPPRCFVCKFPMREIQDQVFEGMYLGEERVGPSTNLDEEMEIAQEIVNRGSG